MASALKAGHDRSSHLRKRAHNPLYHRKPLEEQDRRRQAFLIKVKQAGDDRKWESRSEQILRQDYISRQRQWELEQARTAPEAPASPEEEEEQYPSSRLAEEADMVDQILSQEDQRLEELVSSMQGGEQNRDPDEPQANFNYGSDEEYFDQLFMEVLSQTKTSQCRAGEGSSKQDQEMDESMG